jgi:hypothetical protein
LDTLIKNKFIFAYGNVTNMARGRGLPKSGNSRLAKWQAKYDPTVVQTRFSEVQSVAVSRAQEGIVSIANVQSLVGGILDQYGIAGPMRATYIALAKRFGMQLKG